MRNLFSVLVVIMAVVVSVSAQTGRERKQKVVNRNAVLRVETVEKANSINNDSQMRTVSYSYPADEFKPGVVQVGPRTTYLKEGLSIQEVVRLLGRPSAISERSENDVITQVYSFPRSEGSVLVVDFVNGRVVRSIMESRVQVAQVDR